MALLELFKEQLENESRSIGEAEGLTKRGDLLVWWYFQKLLGMRADEVQEVHCDGHNDYGIDAIRIDEDNYVHFYSFKNPESMDKDFPSGGVDKFVMGLSLMIGGKLTEANANESLLGRAEEMKQAVRNGYRIHLVTSGQGASPDVAVKLNAFIADLKAPSEDFCRWELEDLQALQTSFYTRSRPTIEDVFTFSLGQPPYLVRKGNHESYMFTADGPLLAGIFGKHGEALLQQNIRVSKGDSATNALIRATATGPESGNFLHYNNGIVFLAESATWDAFARTLSIRKYQVVNGGQTIRVLWNAHAAGGQLRSDVEVPVRVITTAHDKDFANNVTVNLNNQNRMEPSFLRSNDAQIVQLAAALTSRGWYFERREGEVRGLKPEERAVLENRYGTPLEHHTIGLKTGIQAYVATYMGDPELAKRYTKQIFIGEADGGRFGSVFSKNLTAENVILAHRIWTAVGHYVNEFKKIKGKRERNAPDWRQYYQVFLGDDLGGNLFAKNEQIIDQVIPPSTFFLSAVIFEDWVRVRGQSEEELVKRLDSRDRTLLNEAIGIIIEARGSLAGESKTWPTLLKSETLFRAVQERLKRQRPNPARP